MNQQGRCQRWWREERGLLLAGVVGLSGCLVYACRGSDGSSATPGTGGSTTDTCASDPSTAENTAAVVVATNALLAALTPEQQTALKYEMTLANAEQWSNFPAGVVKRNGVKLGDMSAGAQSAATALVQVAAGTTGATLLSEIRGADDAFAALSNDNTLFGKGNYYFSIHGTPSAASAWMLQIAGHHFVYNFTYGGKCTSATPLFDGAQPPRPARCWSDGRLTPRPPDRIAGQTGPPKKSAALQGPGTLVRLGAQPRGGERRWPSGRRARRPSSTTTMETCAVPSSTRRWPSSPRRASAPSRSARSPGARG